MSSRRIDDRLAGLPVGHAYVTDAVPSGDRCGSIIRYDLDDDTADAHVFDPGRTPAEPVFVPADKEAGSAGWLLAYVYDAVIHLPARVPYGLPGNWIPDAQ